MVSPELNIDSTVIQKKQSTISSNGNDKNDNDKKDDKYADAKPVPFFSLFRHGTTQDKIIIFVGIIVQSCVGLSFSMMNLVFGEVLDDLSSPATSILGKWIETSGTAVLS